MELLIHFRDRRRGFDAGNVSQATSSDLKRVGSPCRFGISNSHVLSCPTSSWLTMLQPGCREFKDQRFMGSCFTQNIGQVRDEVHRHVAKLMAWSMDYAMQGKSPEMGFHNEKFENGSLRQKLAGADIGKGWRHREKFVDSRVKPTCSHECGRLTLTGPHSSR